MDTIIISDLEVFYHVGVPDEERAAAQRLLLSIEMRKDFTRAAQSDDLGATIDYYAVSRELLKFGDSRNWRLIETLACDIAGMILSKHGVASVTVEVRKFILPEARHVAVRVTRPG